MESLAAATAILEPVTSEKKSASPWQENRYRLVSWWNMEQFAGDELRAAITALEIMHCRASYVLSPEDERVALGNVDVQKIRLQFARVGAALNRSGLPTSAEATAEFCRELDDPEISRPFPEDVATRVEEIQRTISREMRTVVFLCIETKNRQWYAAPLDGWEEAIQRWPKIRMDIEESSKCFALDRFPAAIFHVLQVAEFAVIQVGDLLSVSGDKPGWGCLERLERIRAKGHSLGACENMPSSARLK